MSLHNVTPGARAPDEFNVIAEYPIAVLKQASNRPEAEAFVAFLLSPEGQAVLAKYGFGGR